MRWFSAVSRTIACCPCFTLSMSCGRSRASMMSSSFSGKSSMMVLPASITPPRRVIAQLHHDAADRRRDADPIENALGAEHTLADVGEFAPDLVQLLDRGLDRGVAHAVDLLDGPGDPLLGVADLAHEAARLRPPDWPSCRCSANTSDLRIRPACTQTGPWSPSSSSK